MSVRGWLTGTLAAALLLHVGLPPTARADAAPEPAEVRFRDANAAFAAGDYDSAIAGFRSIVDEGRLSAALLYDLANAEARAGQVGAAILHYERARLLAPRDPDVLANERQVRAASALPDPPRDRWHELAAWLTVDGWAGVAVAALWSACAILAVRALRIRSDRSGRRFSLVVAALACAAVFATSLAWTRLADARRAVVVGSPAALRVAPFASANVSTEIAAGQIVDVERVHGDFTLLRTDDGQAGWLPAGQVRPILPP